MWNSGGDNGDLSHQPGAKVLVRALSSVNMKSSGEHRRGRSMGSGSPAPARVGEKDEDLALFHEMKRREKHNFLHPSPDDLDATLSSKFGGMGAPTKKLGTDLLTSESDKNDYDWLLTPPGTPLFPSLDQESAALAVLSPALSNGSFSSASSASRSLKSLYSPAESLSKTSTRGNPSPRRPSSAGGSTTPNGISRSRSSPSSAAAMLTRPSTPTSGNGTRPSTPTTKSTATTPTSVRASAPNLKLTVSNSTKSYSAASTPTGTRPSTPTGVRSSTPPVRSSTPSGGGRSSTPTSKPSTPTMRRSLSGGRTGLTSPSSTATTRGAPSPKRSTPSSRGNSPSSTNTRRASSVITSIVGMSSEAPPNLRTTMPERPSSAGPNDADGTNRRRPRSPSVARSFSSSSSQDLRQTSSQTSRGSVFSSHDDGFEVSRPSVGKTTRNNSISSPAPGKWHAAAQDELLAGKTTNSFAKRVSRPSITPKETPYAPGTASKKSPSEQQVKRQDAYQNSPTSAYRHLHAHSPVSPFYSAVRSNSLLLKAGSAVNSSVTTSSNASSEHGTTVAADTEGSERDEDDLLSWDSYGRRASTSPRMKADILVLDKDDDRTGSSWQDSLLERANSREQSSHSQGSQSTLDAEVNGFYETDGIASLEMLEQLGLIGENNKLKKSSIFPGRTSDIMSVSSEDLKVNQLRADDGGHGKASPHKFHHEGQTTPTRRLAAKPEKHESSDRLRWSRDFEVELLKRNGEKSLVATDPKVPNSEIRAACLFVRDFKVGLAPPTTQSPVITRHSTADVYNIEEMEMKLRNELSYDWDRTVEVIEMSTTGEKGGPPFREMEGKLSDSPILAPQLRIKSLDPTVPLNLEDHPGTTTATTVEHRQEFDNVTTSVLSNHILDLNHMREPKATLSEDVDLESLHSMNCTPTSAVINQSFDLDDMMDESDAESPLLTSRDVDSFIPECFRTSAATDNTFVQKEVTNRDIATQMKTQPDLGDESSIADEVTLDEETFEPHGIEDAAILKVNEKETELIGSPNEMGFAYGHEGLPADDAIDNSEGKNPEEHSQEAVASLVVENQPEVEDFISDSDQEMEHELPVQRMPLVETQFESEDMRHEVGESQHALVKAHDVLEETQHKVQQARHMAAETPIILEVSDEKLENVWSSDAENDEAPVDVGIQGMVLSEGEHGEDDASDVIQVVTLSEKELDGVVAKVVTQVLTESEGERGDDGADNLIHAAVVSKGSDGHYDVVEMLLDGNDDCRSPDRNAECYSQEHQVLHRESPERVHQSNDVSDSKPSTVLAGKPEFIISMDLDPLPVANVAYELLEAHGPEEIMEFEAHQLVLSESHGLKFPAVTDESAELEAHQQELCESHGLKNYLHVEDSNCSPVENTDEEEMSSPEDISVDEELTYLSDDTQLAEENLVHLPIISSQSLYNPPNDDMYLSPKKNPEAVQQSVDELKFSPSKFEAIVKSPGQDFDSSKVFARVVSEVTSELHQKPGFRSASTLCAALEEQIAGLIQKIDTAIEESSKPHNSTQLETSVAKDRCSSELRRDVEQDDCEASIRSSQDEDLLDMLWEDDESSCWSEGSKDPDVAPAKDRINLRGMNGVRNFRFTDRGMSLSPLKSSRSDLGLRSPLGDLKVRSFSDLGTEKYRLDEPSKKIVYGKVAQRNDFTLRQNRSQELKKSLFTQSLGGCDTVSKHSDLPLVSYEQEGGSHRPDHKKGEVRYGLKTRADMISACVSARQGLDLDTVAKSTEIDNCRTPDHFAIADRIGNAPFTAKQKWAELSAKLDESPEGEGRNLEANGRHVLHRDLTVWNKSPPSIEKTSIRSHGCVELGLEKPTKNGMIAVSWEGANGDRNEWLHRKARRQEQPLRSPSSNPHVENGVADCKRKEDPLIAKHEAKPEVSERECQPVAVEKLDFCKQCEGPAVVDKVRPEEVSLDIMGTSPLFDSKMDSLEEASSERAHSVVLREELSDLDKTSVSHTDGIDGSEEELVESKEFSKDAEDISKVPSDLSKFTRLIERPQGLDDNSAAVPGELNVGTDGGAASRDGNLLIVPEESLEASQKRPEVSMSQLKLVTCSVSEEETHSGFETSAHAEKSHRVEDNNVALAQPNLQWQVNEKLNESCAGQSGSTFGDRKTGEPDIVSLATEGRGSIRFRTEKIDTIGGNLNTEESPSIAEGCRTEEDSTDGVGRHPESHLRGNEPTMNSRVTESNNAHTGDEVEVLFHRIEGDQMDGLDCGNPEVTTTNSGVAESNNAHTGDQEVLINRKVCIEGNQIYGLHCRNSEVTSVDLTTETSEVDLGPLRWVNQGSGCRCDHVQQKATQSGNEDFCSPKEKTESLKRMSSNSAMSVRTISQSGNEEFGNQKEKTEPLKRLPSNSAMSVRTISSSASAPRTDDHCSPNGEVKVRRSITVISPEKLLWEPSLSGDETVYSTRTSPSLSRNMTISEATDTVLSCNTLMNTIVDKASRERGELASTPVSNGELDCLSSTEENIRDQNHGECETENMQGQVVAPGPATVRRALSYLGHRTMPEPPADTSLQIPDSQLIEKVSFKETTQESKVLQGDQKEAPRALSPPADISLQIPDSQVIEKVSSKQTQDKKAQGDQKEVPVKVAKSRCGCSIM